MDIDLFGNEIVKPSRELVYFSKCSKGLHTYYKSPYRDNNNNLLCRSCKSGLVLWDLVKQKNILTLDAVISEIRKEWWRNFWWEIELDEIALGKIKNVSLNGLLTLINKRIRNSVGNVYEFKGKLQPYRDGYQTPYTGNIIFYAQHATATCCRFCIDYWHGIPQGRPLNDEEIVYLSQLVLIYIKIRGIHE